MGSRVNFILKQDDGGCHITLYSHFGATTWRRDLSNAIAKAQPRWSDHTYAARIVVSQLIGDDWDGTTGYGLLVTTPQDMPYLDEPITIDFVNQTVEGESFADFTHIHVRG